MRSINDPRQTGKLPAGKSPERTVRLAARFFTLSDSTRFEIIVFLHHVRGSYKVAT